MIALIQFLSLFFVLLQIISTIFSLLSNGKPWARRSISRNNEIGLAFNMSGLSTVCVLNKYNLLLLLLKIWNQIISFSSCFVLSIFWNVRMPKIVKKLSTLTRIGVKIQSVDRLFSNESITANFLGFFFFRYKWIKSDFPPFKLSTTAKCKQFVFEPNTFLV